ncbi:MAG TPA: glycosyltransferase family 4 protein [Polyangiales bacterium]|jgi:glycosyltransferase involved in cell wall biosynthesis|nr:glycosyltransferase family 4 protein [Polyangiales bacterium]
MHWTVAAPFIHDLGAEDSGWLTPFVPGTRHEFAIVPRRRPLANWHDRASPVSTREEWVDYWHHASDTLAVAREGIITVFPQLPALIGLRQRFSRKKHPLVAWLFNVGVCYPGWRGSVSRFALADVDRFVSHSRREGDMYAEWLGLPRERFVFVPIQKPEIPVEYEEDQEDPFVLLQGSAHRDFPTFIEAVKRLGLRAVIVSGPRALEGIDVPPNVETPFGVSKADCLRLAQQARVNVVPMIRDDEATAAGHVTIAETMWMKRPLIVSNCNGADDYVIDGENGYLVEPHSVDALADAIKKLWDDADLRSRIGAQAYDHARRTFSDEAAGATLGRILDDVADEIGAR